MQRLFVYGTLKPGQERYGPIEKFCNGRNIDLDPKPATTAGLLYALDHGYPGLIRTDTDDVVHGYVLNIDSDPAIVGVINKIEGFDPFKVENIFTPQRMYANLEWEEEHKETQEILISTIEVACWCYYYHPQALEYYFESAQNKIQVESVNAPILLKNGNWSASNNYFKKLSGNHEEQTAPEPAGKKE